MACGLPYNKTSSDPSIPDCGLLPLYPACFMVVSGLILGISDTDTQLNITHTNNSPYYFSFCPLWTWTFFKGILQVHCLWTFLYLPWAWMYILMQTSWKVFKFEVYMTGLYTNDGYGSHQGFWVLNIFGRYSNEVLHTVWMSCGSHMIGHDIQLMAMFCKVSAWFLLLFTTTNTGVWGLHLFGLAFIHNTSRSLCFLRRN